MCRRPHNVKMYVCYSGPRPDDESGEGAGVEPRVLSAGHLKCDPVLGDNSDPWEVLSVAVARS